MRLFPVIILILAGIIISGCITKGDDITNVFKSIPEVQEFLKQHPNAKIVINRWSAEEVSSIIDQISTKCGKGLPVIAMYKVTATDDNINITSWFDSENQQMLCTVIEGSITPHVAEMPPGIHIPPLISILPIILPTSDAPGSDLADIPRYPEFIRFASDIQGENYFTLMYYGGVGVSEVSDFYSSEMPKKGWKLWFRLRVTTEKGDGSILGFTKGNLSATVLIIKDIKQNFTLVMISKSPLVAYKATAIYEALAIVSFAPPSWQVSDVVGTSRTFNITVNQIANVTWYINGIQVQLNESVTKASYTSINAPIGEWYVTAVAENENGTAQQAWFWLVVSPPPTCDTSVIYGYKFNDTNGNGIQDVGESGLDNWTIRLYGFDTCTGASIDMVVTTNATGYFEFRNITAGSYVLEEVLLPGWQSTTSLSYIVTVPLESTSIQKDFGNIRI